MTYPGRAILSALVCLFFTLAPTGAKTVDSYADFHSVAAELKKIKTVSSPQAVQEILNLLLHLYLWSKDSFSVQQEPEYALISDLVNKASASAQMSEKRALQAAFSLLQHDYHQASKLTTQLSDPWSRMMAVLVGEPKAGDTQIWRISLEKSRVLYRDIPDSALTGSILVEALLEAADDSAQPEPLLKEAVTVLKNSLMREPENLYLAYQQAQLDYLLGNRELAFRRFDALVARAPQSYLLAEAVGNFYVWTKEGVRARTAYEQALRQRSNCLRLYQKLENVLLAQQQILTAVEMYLTGLRQHPSESSLYAALKALAIQNQEASVLNRLRESLQKSPDNTYLWLYQGDVLLLLQRQQEARQAYEKAVMTGSGALFAYESLFQLLWQQKDIPALEHWLNQARTQAGLLSTTHYWSGMILLHQQQPLQAIIELEKASLKDHTVQYALMMAYRQSQQYSKARNLLQGMLKENPKDIQLLLNMGDLYFEERNFAKAEDYYLWADKLEPYQADVYFSLGNLYSETARPLMAIQAFERVILLRPEEPDARNNLGNVLLKERRFQEALQTFEQILVFKPEYATAYYNLACAYALMNQKEQAFRFLEQAIRRDPQFKQLALQDPDFSGLRQDKKFLKLVQ